MQSAYLDDKRVVVTRIKFFNLVVSQVKTEEKDGYNAIQVVFGEERRHPTKPIMGHLKKLKKYPKYVHEIRVDDPSQFEVGQKIEISEVIERGQVVNVQGTTKGKGFTGVIKRWGFARQPKTHGQSDRTRAPGSIGQTTGVGRVFKGKKMAGRHGGFTKTVKSAKVIHIDPINQEIWVTGPVPGNKGGLLTISLTNSKLDLPPLKNIAQPAQTQESQQESQQEVQSENQEPQEKQGNQETQQQEVKE